MIPGWVIEYKWVILFYLGVILLIYLNRSKFEFPARLVALYKTKVGLKLMDSISSKYREFVKLMGLIGIGVGYVGFVIFTVLIVKILIDLFQKPDMVGVSPVLPGVPIAGTGLVFPLVTGIITLFIIIIVHEFSHGVVARAHGIKILSSGIALFGPIPGAFVEPDEKQMEKKSDVVQYSVFAAGPFSNIILGVVVLVLMVYVASPITMAISENQGILLNPLEGYPAQEAGLEKGTVITGVNGIMVSNASSFMNATAGLKPGDQITFNTLQGDITFTAAQHPEDEDKGYMGIIFAGENLVAKQGYGILYPIVRWIDTLFFWVFFISINIGLINLYPIFITDGARMLKTTFEKIYTDKKKAMNVWLNVNKACVLLFMLILFVQIYNWLL